MLSPGYNIGEFVEKVKNRSFDEVIVLTDREATETERCLYRDCPAATRRAARNYAVSLKDFILFLRHGIITRSTKGLNLRAFKTIRVSSATRKTNDLKYRP